MAKQRKKRKKSTIKKKRRRMAQHATEHTNQEVQNHGIIYDKPNRHGRSNYHAGT